MWFTEAGPGLSERCKSSTRQLPRKRHGRFVRSFILCLDMRLGHQSQFRKMGLKRQCVLLVPTQLQSLFSL